MVHPEVMAVLKEYRKIFPEIHGKPMSKADWNRFLDMAPALRKEDIIGYSKKQNPVAINTTGNNTINNSYDINSDMEYSSLRKGSSKGKGVVVAAILLIGSMVGLNSYLDNSSDEDNALNKTLPMDNTDPTGQVIKQEVNNKITPKSDSSINDKIDNPIDTSSKYRKDFVTIKTSDGDIEGKITHGDICPECTHVIIENSGEVYSHTVKYYDEEQFNDRGLGDVFKEYHTDNVEHPGYVNVGLETFRIDDLGNKRAKAYIDIKRDPKTGLWDWNSAVLVYDGEIQIGATNTLTYIKMCTNAKKEANKNEDWYRPFLENCKTWL